VEVGAGTGGCCGASQGGDVDHRARIHGAADATAQLLACCAPVTKQVIGGDEEVAQLAVLLKAMADPVGIKLLSLSASHEGDEACVCDLNDAFDLSQPTISHHLKILLDAGLVTRDKRGVWAHYKLVHAVLDAVAARLTASVAVNPSNAQEAAGA
jgi:ArsR family transcriptional regulator